MRRSDRPWIALAALNGLLAVAAGAIAAHGMRDLTARELLRTGAQYQLAHAVAALACLVTPMRSRRASLSAGLFGSGGFLFGVSLYLLAVSDQRWLGAVTPLGGLLMLAGWAALLWGAITSSEEAS